MIFCVGWPAPMFALVFADGGREGGLLAKMEANPHFLAAT